MKDRGAALRASALAALVALAAGLVLGRSLAPPGAAPAAHEARGGVVSPTGPSAPVAPSPSSAEPPRTPATVTATVSTIATSTDVTTRARAGELAALKELDKKPLGERTVAEALALEAGHAELARREGQSLLRALERDPALWRDASTLAHVVRLSQDAEVAPSLLEGLARSSSPVAGELLYDLVERADRGGRLTLLADDLLVGPDVRPELSRALAVAVALRHATSCGALSSHLGAVLEHGDERAARVLERADKRTGCGPKGRDDCWACLRDEPNKGRLERAREAAKGRAASRPWRRAPR